MLCHKVKVVNSRDSILLQSMVYGAGYVSADSVNNQTCSLQESWLEQNTELLCVLISFDLCSSFFLLAFAGFCV
jgi:hypothetical protein